MHRPPHLWLATVTAALISASCASTGGVPRPFPTPGTRAPGTERTERAATRGRVDQHALVATALDLRGTPYKDGGIDPTGFDCSGFTRYVFARHGVALPRSVQDQSVTGRSVSRDGILPGDLLFFDTKSSGASHVGIAIGRDAFVHAPSSTGVVRVERYSSRYWRRRLVGVQRVTVDR